MTKKNDETKEVAEKEVELLAKIAELTEDLQRTRADFENFRKQTEASISRASEAAKAATVLKILPLIDDMGRAIALNPEVLAPVLKTLEKAMGELGLSKIDAGVGVEFNPDLHEAVMMDEEGEGEKEVIVEELRPGYRYGGEVIRASMVKVGRG